LDEGGGLRPGRYGGPAIDRSAGQGRYGIREHDGVPLLEAVDEAREQRAVEDVARTHRRDDLNAE
jgi:hypothetical protein